jgi:hypothetical protein
MERAARIFYEYVQDYAPELISPQYQSFFDATQSSLQNRSEQKKMIDLDELHDKISLASLSQTLVGLSAQALSYRREASDQDYLHEHYKQLVTPGNELE